MDGVKEDTETMNIEQFMNTQNEMNKDIVAFMEKYAEDKATRDQQQSATLTLLQKLIEKNVEPPAKKARSDLVEATPGSSLQSTEPAEATPGSVTGKEKKFRSDDEAILGSTHDDVVELHDQSNNKTLVDEELELYNRLANGEYQPDNADTVTVDEESKDLDYNNMTEEQIESYMCKEYSDWLSQTEEKVGPPVSQVLGVLCERLWGKVLLSQEKKKEMHDGLSIPSNCKSLKAPILNPQIHIRVHENARKKDEAAKSRQVNMARAAIPLLYTLGELDKSMEAMKAQSKFLSIEPKTLDEAKKIISVVKSKNDLATTTIASAKTHVSKSFRMLNYYCTEATRKRRQDVCDALGSAFKPYGLETTPPDKHLFDEDQLKRMKSEIKAIKPKAEASKNLNGSTKSRRSSTHNSGYYGRVKAHF